MIEDEFQYALDRMCTPLHDSRLSGATAAEDARCMAVIKAHCEQQAAEIARLTAERDALLSACRRAVMALAAAAERDPAFRPDYEALSAAIDALAQGGKNDA